ncbi:MAG: hypothetical protein AAF633_21765, partial [Chloroflexota bacterium]
MTRRSITYDVITAIFVAGLLFTLFPAPVWGQVLGTSYGEHLVEPIMIEHDPAGDEFAKNIEAAADSGSLAPLLPDETELQLAEMGILNDDGVPRGILFDQGALEQALVALDEPLALSNPISISRLQSAYVPLDADNGRIEVTFEVANNMPPETVPPIPENATITDTVEILGNFDFSADPATVRNVIIADTLLPEAQFVAADPLADQLGSEF